MCVCVCVCVCVCFVCLCVCGLSDTTLTAPLPQSTTPSEHHSLRAEGWLGVYVCRRVLVRVGDCVDGGRGRDTEITWSEAEPNEPQWKRGRTRRIHKIKRETLSSFGGKGARVTPQMLTRAKHVVRVAVHSTILVKRIPQLPRRPRVVRKKGEQRDRPKRPRPPTSSEKKEQRKADQRAPTPSREEKGRTARQTKEAKTTDQ